jgi:hypothetical protein
MPRMHALITINIGDFISQNARASMLAAAERWQADFVEVTHSFHPGLHPAYQKCRVLSRLLHYERIILLDGDMLVRDDTPNTFQKFRDTSKLYAVSDLAARRAHSLCEFDFDIKEAVRTRYFPLLQALSNAPVTLNAYVDSFINTGFLLCSPRRFLPVFQFVEDNLPAPSDSLAQNAHFEQALFNFAVQAFYRDSLVIIPEDWNYIEPDIRLGRMSHFIYHFTGPRPVELRSAIGRFPWTCAVCDEIGGSSHSRGSMLPAKAANCRI